MSESDQEQKDDKDIEPEFVFADSSSFLAMILAPVEIERIDDQFDAVIPVGARNVAKGPEAPIEPVAAVAHFTPPFALSSFVFMLRMRA